LCAKKLVKHKMLDGADLEILADILNGDISDEEFERSMLIRP